MGFPQQPSEPGAAPGNAAEHRQKVQRAAQERAALRDSELEAQSSPLNDPRKRIEIWERLHALQLPRSSGHVLVKVIARQTRLTIAQVHQEQQRRAGVSVPTEGSADHEHTDAPDAQLLSDTAPTHDT